MYDFFNVLGKYWVLVMSEIKFPIASLSASFHISKLFLLLWNGRVQGRRIVNISEYNGVPVGKHVPEQRQGPYSIRLCSVFTVRYELFGRKYRALTAEAWLRSLVNPCAICDAQGRCLINPVNIIPPMFHTHLRLHVGLIRRTNERSLGTITKQCCFRNRGALGCRVPFYM
jgi:hypothetical protein